MRGREADAEVEVGGAFGSEVRVALDDGIDAGAGGRKTERITVDRGCVDCAAIAFGEGGGTEGCAIGCAELKGPVGAVVQCEFVDEGVVVVGWVLLVAGGVILIVLVAGGQAQVQLALTPSVQGDEGLGKE